MCAWPEILITKYASSVKVRQSFVAHRSQVSNMRYRLKLGDAFVGQVCKHQVRVIWSVKVRQLLWPVNPSIRRALSAEVGRRFCCPKFQLPNARNRCMARKLTDAFLHGLEWNQTV